MGRQNRSRKRRDEMNKIKKARYDAKELIRLKKTLGLLDAEGNEIMKDIADVVDVKTAKEIKRDAKTREQQELIYEHQESLEKGQKVKVTNDKTGVEHVFNSKTLKDQYGNYPAWFKKKKTAKRLRKKQHSQTKNFKQAWTTVNVPL
ncbi:protein LLP homolog [Drosophila madeirensis]|uniref:Protein LLP homolog n=1 Tax=Drosophila madeirensis TaxID=30013 RepID=A0AAU9FQU8_DROMD|nr:protein LLP homolog [Drosophila subobscura]